MEKIQDKIGVSEQKIAEQCCAENLRKEVEATIASGILPLEDGRVPLTCSGDTGWQGNGSRMTYNSQSGQTTLCGACTKKVVAYKFFSKLCRTCHDHSKKKKRMNQSPYLPIDVPKTGQNQVRQWNPMVFWIVRLLFGTLGLVAWMYSSVMMILRRVAY